MKSVLCLGLLIVVLSSFKDGKALQPVRKVDSICIRKVTMRYITTPSGVGCDNFERAFEGSVDTYTFKKPLQIKKIMTDILAATSYRKMFDINTRAKIFIYYNSGRPDSLCMDGNGDFLQNGYSKSIPNDDLIDFIDSLPRTHPNW